LIIAIMAMVIAQQVRHIWALAAQCQEEEKREVEAYTNFAEYPPSGKILSVKSKCSFVDI
jgi:uncharacterized membrane protein YecN with MAPEG domain